MVDKSYHDELELRRLLKDNPGFVVCTLCEGTGEVVAMFSGVDPSCRLCDGEGIVFDE